MLVYDASLDEKNDVYYDCDNKKFKEGYFSNSIAFCNTLNLNSNETDDLL